MSVGIMTDEKLYTVNEVAGMLRIGHRTVRRMIAEGEIAAFKVRDEYRIRQSTIEAYIEKQEQKREE
jgi:excisionase family DNA binding protein